MLRLVRASDAFVPPFDFRRVAALPLEERFSASVKAARQVLARSRYQTFSDFPCIPDRGAEPSELARLETSLGAPLPDEYRVFLSRHRYLKLDDGREIGGLDHQGLYVTESPWLSDQHCPGRRYLVFAAYWRYADGDQLMFDLSDPAQLVIAYLHEHGPAFAFYLPSFSLALWRLVHEE